MFTAYIDDSGSDPSQKVANATALIIPAARIWALEGEWARLKATEGFTCFHTSEFVARNPKSEFANWEHDKHARVFRRVRQICKRYGVRAMSFTVNKRDYDDIVPADFRKHSGIFHYTWAIRHVLKHIVQWRLSTGAREPLEYVFDWMGKRKNNLRRREIEEVMEQAEEDAAEHGIAGEYTNWSLRHREGIPGLQCVDALAWTVYQYALFAFCKKPLIPDAKSAMDDFGKHLNGGWGFDVTVTRDNLKKWIDAETADGRSIKRFKAWEERKRATKESRRGI